MNLNLFANFMGPIGYAQHAREFAYAISDYVDLNLIPMEAFNPQDITNKLIKLHAMVNSTDINFSNIGIAITYGNHWSLSRFCGSQRIAYTTWEMERLAPDWVNALNQMDATWVPSSWCKKVFEKSGVENVDVVHEGVDVKSFNPFVPSLNELIESRDLTRDKPVNTPYFTKNDKFTFLLGGKWEQRKGQDAAVRAFAHAFEPDEPVQMVLHCTNPFEPNLNIFYHLFAMNLPTHAEIRVGQGSFSSTDYASFFATGDAYVFPTRAEGFGLPILEAMASGLPVITTKVTGHADFVNKDVVYIIKTKKVPVNDPQWFPEFGDTKWNDPDVGHLVELMRHVYEHPEEAKKKGRAAYNHAKKWTWDKGAKEAMKLLEKMT